MLARAHRLSRLLQQQRLIHWIDFGALLGSIRTGALLPDDPDIDFDFLESDLPRLLQLGDEIRHVAQLELYFDPDARILRAVAVEVLEQNRQASPGTLSTFSRIASLCYVDFYPCTHTGRHLLHFYPRYNFRRFFIEPLGIAEISGFEFPAPQHAEDLLVNRYGKNWKTPLPRERFERLEASLIRPMDTTIGLFIQTVAGTRASSASIVHLADQYFDRVVVGVVEEPPTCDRLPQPANGVHFVPFQNRVTLAFLRSLGCKYATLPEIEDHPPFAWTPDVETSRHHLPR